MHQNCLSSFPTSDHNPEPQGKQNFNQPIKKSQKNMTEAYTFSSESL
jgi:hypothetical protein